MEQCYLEEIRIISSENTISLSLEYLKSQDFDTGIILNRTSESWDDEENVLSFSQQLGPIIIYNKEINFGRKTQDVQEVSPHKKRYLLCPADMNISILKKFIRMKHNLTDKEQVDIIYERADLPDHYTLMEVAYTKRRKEAEFLELFYKINKIKQKSQTPAITLALNYDEMQAKQITSTENPKMLNESFAKDGETHEQKNESEKRENLIMTDPDCETENFFIASAKPGETFELSKILNNENSRNVWDTTQKTNDVRVKINENMNRGEKSKDQSEDKGSYNSIGKRNVDNEHENEDEDDKEEEAETVKSFVPAYTCKTCSESFPVKTSFQAHLKTHNVTRNIEVTPGPHQCSLCPRSFLYYKSLYYHLATHTGEKRYSCEICGKRFFLKTQISEHMFTHFQNKQFNCSRCPKTFKCLSALRMHKRNFPGPHSFS